MNAFFQQLAQLGAVRLIIMFGVAAGVAGALMTVGMGLGTEDRTVLYTSQDMSAIADMSDRLSQANIPFEISAGGTVILTPRQREVEARLLLARDGLPGSASMGYELFDQQRTLGATQFVQNLNRVRALEGELARTLVGLAGVADARVHLALPERRLFDRDAETPSASVVLTLRGAELSRGQAKAVRNLVAGAVPGLTSNRITILDADGALLADGSGDGEDAASAALNDRKSQEESRLAAQVTRLVERLVGRGSAAVQVSLDLDMTQVTSTAEVFDPEGQVVVSTETREESSSGENAEDDGTTTVTENIPETAEDGEGVNTQRTTSRTADNALVERTNFQNTRRTRSEIRMPGELRRLSVAVAVDGVRTETEEGGVVYEPRAAEVMAEIEALVKAAIGFSETRGDIVTVTNLPFPETTAPVIGTVAPPPISFAASDIMRFAELGVLLVVALLVILLVARPLLKAAGPSGDSGGFPALPAPAGAVTVAGVSPAAAAGDDGGPLALMAPDDGSEEMVDIASVDGALKASSVKKITDIVNEHPDKTVSVIRGWLHEGESDGDGDAD